MALKGIRVVEMAGLAPVPYCGMMLADFGAKVIRIDKGQWNPDRLSRGKQSLSVNLKQKDGVGIVKKLCKSADVLVEPFRPGVMEKLGLGPDVLTTENPKLIYARLTGYGQNGPLSKAAGHDINYLGISGLLSRLGETGKPPQPPVNLLADFGGGGLMCAFGIVLALYERASSNKGQVIDANMVEGSAYVGSFLDVMKGSMFPDERGKNLLDGGSAFYKTYETKDGLYMAVGSLEPQFYAALLQGMELDPSNFSQLDDQQKQAQQFAAIFKTKTRAEWNEIFTKLDACVAPVLTPEEAAALPHNKDKGSFFRMENSDLQAAPAPRLLRTPGIDRQLPLPEVGQHTVEILTELGYTPSQISDFQSSGAVWQNDLYE